MPERPDRRTLLVRRNDRRAGAGGLVVAVLGMVAGLVAAAAVWRQSVRSGQRLGAGMGCLLLGGVLVTLLVGGWGVLVVLSGSDLGLTTP